MDLKALAAPTALRDHMAPLSPKSLPRAVPLRAHMAPVALMDHLAPLSPKSLVQPEPRTAVTAPRSMTLVANRDLLSQITAPDRPVARATALLQPGSAEPEPQTGTVARGEHSEELKRLASRKQR